MPAYCIHEGASVAQACCWQLHIRRISLGAVRQLVPLRGWRVSLAESDRARPAGWLGFIFAAGQPYAASQARSSV